ncbi:hypothetical protein GYMLUDRAFT_45590 [Collybiopsis luxurians FD-317 M1]|uniref:Uncharacterized protein n=1 Tax=Collybiopsis luxurians FD-317 M1 TaxID=944289 RepID=A0A0D0BS06_9AGAR|nr:hypothetical protein GYMLUDRAFT_45590 [Collybiopsis luxurians FD-317 M1]
MASWDQQTLDTPMDGVEENVPITSTSNLGAMFTGASNFTISGSPSFNVWHQTFGSFNEEDSTPAPPGYTPNMADLGPASPFFTGRQDVLLELESYFSLDTLSTSIHERKIFVLYGMGGAGKT